MSTALKDRVEVAPELDRGEKPAARNPAPQVGPVRNPSVVEIHPGMVLNLSQRDHLGTGNLALKVGPVADYLRSLPVTLEWVVLTGETVLAYGPGVQCKACVRVSAIPGAQRKANWRPESKPPPGPADSQTASEQQDQKA